MSDQLAASSRVRVPRRVPGTTYPATNPTPQAEGGASLLVSRTVVRRGLLLSVAFLLVGSTVVKSINIGWGNDRIFGLLQLLWLDREANLPAWFSSALFFIAAILSALIAAATRHEGRLHLGWRVIAGILLLLAIDEVAQFHEILASYPVHARGLGLFPEGGKLFSWVPFAIPPVAAVCWVAARFLRMLPSAVGNRLAAGLAIFLSAALGVEALTGQIAFEPQTWMYLIFATIEEGAEMIGVIVFIDGLLVYLETLAAIPIQFVQRDSSRRAA